MSIVEKESLWITEATIFLDKLQSAILPKQKRKRRKHSPRLPLAETGYFLKKLNQQVQSEKEKVA